MDQPEFVYSIRVLYSPGGGGFYDVTLPGVTQGFQADAMGRAMYGECYCGTMGLVPNPYYRGD